MITKLKTMVAVTLIAVTSMFSSTVTAATVTEQKEAAAACVASTLYVGAMGVVDAELIAPVTEHYVDAFLLISGLPNTPETQQFVLDAAVDAVIDMFDAQTTEEGTANLVVALAEAATFCIEGYTNYIAR